MVLTTRPLLGEPRFRLFAIRLGNVSDVTAMQSRLRLLNTVDPLCARFRIK